MWNHQLSRLDKEKLEVHFLKTCLITQLTWKSQKYHVIKFCKVRNIFITSLKVRWHHFTSKESKKTSKHEKNPEPSICLHYDFTCYNFMPSFRFIISTVDNKPLKRPHWHGPKGKAVNESYFSHFFSWTDFSQYFENGESKVLRFCKIPKKI